MLLVSRHPAGGRDREVGDLTAQVEQQREGGGDLRVDRAVVRGGILHDQALGDGDVPPHVHLGGAHAGMHQVVGVAELRGELTAEREEGVHVAGEREDQLEVEVGHALHGVALTGQAHAGAHLDAFGQDQLGDIHGLVGARAVEVLADPEIAVGQLRDADVLIGAELTPPDRTPVPLVGIDEGLDALTGIHVGRDVDLPEVGEAVVGIELVDVAFEVGELREVEVPQQLTHFGVGDAHAVFLVGG